MRLLLLSSAIFYVLGLKLTYKADHKTSLPNDPVPAITAPQKDPAVKSEEATEKETILKVDTIQQPVSHVVEPSSPGKCNSDICKTL